MGSADAGCQEKPQGRRAEQLLCTQQDQTLQSPRAQAKQTACLLTDNTDIVITTIQDSVEDHNGVCFHAPSPFEIT